ncbi:MAG: YggS family pyridoxal phosphate-dependent enzyme [Tepidiformaceae bacterium]
MTTRTSTLTLTERVAEVRTRINLACERSGRDASTVTLIGVSKTFAADAAVSAFEAGIRDFGENRVQEGAAKAVDLAARGIEPCWHLIGHLQTNKVRAALKAFAILHAIDSGRLLEAIASAAASPVRVFIEVNVASEASKFGVTPGELPVLLRTADGLPNVVVEGLMTVAPRVDDGDEVRPVFRTLHGLAEANGLTKLSMGMSGDFETAIEEGATHIRVGRAIFGERA